MDDIRGLTPINFGPKGCVDARLDIRRTWEPGGLNLLYRTSERATAEMVAGLRERIGAARLYWVADPMCSLIATAATSVPGETSLLPELLPCAHGMVFLAEPISTTVGRKRAATTVLMWTVHDDDFIEVSSYANEMQLGFGLVGAADWKFGERLDTPEGGIETELDLASALEDRRLLLALLALLASPGITRTDVAQADRAAVRRSRRAGIEPDDIRVIYLRSPERAAVDGDGVDHYRHRWIVDGHWRSQPYGPGRAFRKPVWIAPHVKGPADAPLLGGEKVRAVVR